MKRNSIISVSALMVVLIVVMVSVGCSVPREKFDVSGKINEDNYKYHLIESVDDIKLLVTDDDKLVINYFDAYTWMISFDENDIPDKMTYIYKFDNEKIASEMASVRKSELEKNRTMKVISSFNIEEYVVVTLVDSSFNNVTRDKLEYNFEGLIVY